jgi:formate dehydrogenase major subunit
MGQKDKEAGRMELSRRDFLKVSAAGAAAATALDWAPAPAMAVYPLHGGDTAANMKTFHSTCPYCSAQCGQHVAVGGVTGEVYDIYGDVDSPTNNGGLCAKGAGSYQLVTNNRRLGTPGQIAGLDDADQAWVRTANDAWVPIALDTALAEIAGGHTGDGRTHLGLVGIRNAGGAPSPDNYHNNKSVMFFGSSHCNNEVNYTYRKLIATFGTSNTEHQARI